MFDSAQILSLLIRFALYPGLVAAVLAGALLQWVAARAAARVQSRVGPPLLSALPLPSGRLLAAGRYPEVAFLILALGLATAGVALLPLPGVPWLQTALPVRLPGSGRLVPESVLVPFLLLQAALVTRALAWLSRAELVDRLAGLRLAQGAVLAAVPMAGALGLSLAIWREVDLTAVPPAARGGEGYAWVLAAVALVLAVASRLGAGPFSASRHSEELAATAGSGMLPAWLNGLLEAVDWSGHLALAAVLMLPRGAGPLWFVVLALVLAAAIGVLAAQTGRLRIGGALVLGWAHPLLLVGAGFSVLALASGVRLAGISGTTFAIGVTAGALVGTAVVLGRGMPSLVLQGTTWLGPRATRRYPLRPGGVILPRTYRGALEFRPDLCTGCGLCVYVCPSRAASIEATEAGVRVAFSPSACIYCGACRTECPTGAIKLSHIFSLVGPRPLAGLVAEVAKPTCPECGSRWLAPASIRAMLCDSTWQTVASDGRSCSSCLEAFQASARLARTEPVEA